MLIVIPGVGYMATKWLALGSGKNVFVLKNK